MASAAEIVFDDGEGNLLALIPDTVVSEGPHRLANVATEQEVEVGAAVTDHVRPESDVLQLEVVFSNTPIRQIEARDDVFGFEVTGAVDSLDLDLPGGPALSAYSQSGPPAKGPEVGERGGDTGKAQVWQVDGDEVTRVQDNWDLIRQARDGAYLATITTELRTYDSMVLLGAETTRRAEDGSWIRVLLDFRQIRQVATELVDVAAPARPRGQRREEGGSDPTDPADPEDAESTSILHGLIYGGG